MDPRRAAALSRFKAPLKNAWMLAEITSAKDGQSQAGRDQVTVALAPVSGNKVNRDLTISAYIPRAMDGDDARTLDNIRRKGLGFVKAVDPDFPPFPRRIGKGVYEIAQTIDVTDLKTGEVLTYQEGEQVGYKGNNDVVGEIYTRVFQGLAALPEKCASLVGMRVFVKPQKATMTVEDDRPTQFVDQIRGELPDGEVYLDDDFVDTDLANEFLAQLGLTE